MPLRSIDLAIIVALLVSMSACTIGMNEPSDHPGVVKRVTYDYAGRRLAYLSEAPSSADAQDDAARASGRSEGSSEVRVIYIHGTPGRAAALEHLVAEPVPGTDSIAVDRLGFGRSDPAPVVSYEQHAAAIATLLDDRPGAKSIVVGHSLGGPIAARLAADYPDRVGGLVIVAGSLDPRLEQPRWFNRVAAAPIVNPLLNGDLRRANRELMAAPEQARALDRVIHRVRAPTIVLHGLEDSLVPVENVLYMRRAMTGVEIMDIVVVPDEEHFLPWTRAGLIRRAVAALVEWVREH